MVEFSTTARELNVLLCDHPRQPQEHQYFQVLVDGLAVAHQKLERQDCRYRIELPAATRAHRVSLIKQTEAEYGETVFFGLELAEDTLLLQRPPERKHRLMILGDSVTAGFGVDAGDNAVKNEPDWFTRTQNLAVTYGMLAASTLALDYVPLAYSGKGVSRNQDPSDPVVYGMLLPRLLTNPDGPAFPDEPTPDAILVNLGTNDFWTNRNIRSFTSAYTTLLQQLRERFAAAPILCTIGPMLQDRWHYPRLSYARAGIYRAIQARRAAGDRALYYFELAPQNIPADGVGVDWHPSRTTHAKVANQLIAVLRGLLGW